MGQYYRVAFKKDGEINISDRRVKGVDYIFAKIMEHGYLNNTLVDAVAEEMHHSKIRLAWVGDYADEGNEVDKITGGDLSYEKVWGDDEMRAYTFPFTMRFDYRGKFLVNHTKNEYISFDRYLKDFYSIKDDFVISPFVILTAIGNGRGGGDYYGKCEEKVGTWAWDEISIEDTAPEGFVEDTETVFAEGVD